MPHVIALIVAAALDVPLRAVAARVADYLAMAPGGAKVGGGPAYISRTASDAIRRGVIGFDAVKQLLVARLEGKPPRLDASAYPYLPRATVRTTAAADYTAPLSGRAA